MLAAYHAASRAGTPHCLLLTPCPLLPSLAFPRPLTYSGYQGQLGQPQLHALHLMQAAATVFVMEVPRKIESLDPNRLQPWKR